MVALFTVLGNIFGSFLSLVSYRLPLGQDIIYARSQCPKCHYKLRIRNLIPILSWLYFKGKCVIVKNQLV